MLRVLGSGQTPGRGLYYIPGSRLGLAELATAIAFIMSLCTELRREPWLLRSEIVVAQGEYHCSCQRRTNRYTR